MKIVDANVLLYAVDRRAKRHSSAKAWLDRVLTGNETILLPWICLLAFIRLATHPGIYEKPLTPERALDVVESWINQSAVMTPEPDGSHTTRLRELLNATGRGGNLVNDAHIAALAVQYRAVVITYDSDFGRFPGIRWEAPE